MLDIANIEIDVDAVAEKIDHRDSKEHFHGLM
jgi:hypothetical protein